jgi:hypothetical protein
MASRPTTQAHEALSSAGRLSAPVVVHDDGSRRFRPGLAVRGRVLLACAAVLIALWTVRKPLGPEGTAEASLVHALGTRGLNVRERDIMWLEPPQGALALRSALVVASRKGELPDVSFVEARATRSGRVLELWNVTNLTRSSSASESQLVRVGPFVAFTVSVGPRVAAVTVLDTRGESSELTAGWPAHARVQNAITNLQDSGRTRGFGRIRYGLEPAPEHVQLRVDGARLRVELDDDAALVLDPARALVLEGDERARPQLAQKGQPGTITWVVDTVRNLSFVGAAPIEWLEHTVFGITDRATRAYYDFVDEGSAARTGAEAQAALVVAPVTAEVRRRDALRASDPELRWPPAKLEPVLPEPLAGEGEWLPVIDHDMVAQYEGAPPAFYQTFVRVDAERTYTRVYVTLWDPRQIQLHVAMGTTEPVSATGETGQGQVPRDPRVLSRLVGAFNGGFQALHGEFGMMSEGRVYLPPKPYAATVAVHEDGRVGLGSWPGPGKSGWDEARANAQIPPDMIAMRQNLTTVVEDGEYNPWKRWWWGAAPTFATEQTFIHRSGLCVTRDGHLAYVWGESMGPEQLGAAMIAVRCARGMHLDMNGKHTGFELYRTFAPGTQPEPLARKLDPETEHQGAIEGGGGFTARARLAVKTMTPLRFPRYLQRDPRDFFFLTQKPVLPGPAIAFAAGSVAFSSAGLPHAGWPHAFARARLAAGEHGAWLVRVDLARAVPAPVAAPDLSRPLAYLVRDPSASAAALQSTGELALYVDHVAGLRRFAIGTAPEAVQVMLRGAPIDRARGVHSALAIDAEGFLLYAQADPGSEIFLAEQLAAAKLDAALALPSAARMLLVTETGQASVNGEAIDGAAPEAALALMAETRPTADVMFGDVEPKPYRFWGYLQGQRVRYFPTGEPRFRAPEDALASPKDAGVSP